MDAETYEAVRVEISRRFRADLFAMRARGGRHEVQNAIAFCPLMAPGRRVAGSPGRRVAGSPGRRVAGSPGMIRRALPGIILLMLVGVSATVLNGMRHYRVQQLILCSEPGNGFVIPAPICRQYLFHFRMERSDIQALQADGGVAFVLQSEHPRRFELAARFLASGLDANADIRAAQEERAYTALHSAAILNQPENVALLLRHGADRSKPDSEGKTPLQVAEQLQQQRPDEDRSAVINALR